MRSIIYIGLFVAALGVAWLWLFHHRAYTPVQPVPFSHAAHTATDRGAMPCQTCHTGAERGSHAGLPAPSACLDCHRHILADDPRLLALHASANPDCPTYTGEPLHWVRHDYLPDYAHFNHIIHLRKGYSCERCHPNPDAPQPQTMSTCLSCHRDEGVPTNCTQCHN